MTDSANLFAQLVPGVRVEGPLLPEPVEVLATIPMGASIKLIARGIRTNQTHQPLLDAAQVAQLTIASRDEPFDGDALRFRLGVEAHRLGLAFEYFLKLPRIRFLLADDPGAGKTVMAGLLLKELKSRDLVQRPLNTWQKEKFILHVHSSTLHTWWISRPLAIYRTALYELPLTNSTDLSCPQAFLPSKPGAKASERNTDDSRAHGLEVEKALGKQKVRDEVEVRLRG